MYRNGRTVNNRTQYTARNNYSGRAGQYTDNTSSGNAGWIGSALKIGAVLFTAVALVATGDGAEASEVVSEAFRK